MLRPVRTLLTGLICGLFLTVGPACHAPAADPKPAPNDPKAQQLLEEVARAYQHLGAYADHGEFVLAATVGGKSESNKSPMKISIERPNKLRLDAGQVEVASDGKTMTTAVVPFKKYTAQAAPKAITFETFRQGPLGSMLFGGPSGPCMFVVLNMLVGNEPAKALGALGGALVLDADRELDGTPCKAIRIDQPQGPDIRMLVDSQTKLLRAVDMVFDAKELWLKKGLQDKVTIDRFGWSSGTIATKDLPSGTFAFQPPQGFSKVESLAEAEQAEKYPVNELVGKPAPSFTLTVLDGAGKTKTLSKSDLAGKVVMIDFWTTWCGPCLMELPEVQKLIEAYAKDKKDVLIIALSQDDAPQELSEVRKLVEKTLDDKKIKLTGTSVGLVGLDPSHSVGDAFAVNAYPTVVLLDGKGVVQAAHVGIPDGEIEGVVRVLGKAIEHAARGQGPCSQGR